jgi:IS4 transposase
VFDQGYTDLKWWKQLGEQRVYFVSRLRADGKYEIEKSHKIPSSYEHLRKDQSILLPGHRQVGKEGLRGLRRMEVWIEEKQEMMVLVTNHPDLAANTIAEIYRQRWQIETFFKSLKQLLKIKTFVGAREKAVRTQIWTALIVMLMLRWLKLKSPYGWSLSNLVALLRQQLFVYRDLWSWLNHPFQGPPGTGDSPQLALPV